MGFFHKNLTSLIVECCIIKVFTKLNMNKIFRIKWNLNSNSFVVCHERNKSRLSNSKTAPRKRIASLVIFMAQHFEI